MPYLETKKRRRRPVGTREIMTVQRAAFELSRRDAGQRRLRAGVRQPRPSGAAAVSRRARRRPRDRRSVPAAAGEVGTQSRICSAWCWRSRCRWACPATASGFLVEHVRSLPGASRARAARHLRRVLPRRAGGVGIRGDRSIRGDAAASAAAASRVVRARRRVSRPPAAPGAVSEPRAAALCLARGAAARRRRRAADARRRRRAQIPRAAICRRSTGSRS